MTTRIFSLKKMLKPYRDSNLLTCRVLSLRKSPVLCRQFSVAERAQRRFRHEHSTSRPGQLFSIRKSRRTSHETRAPVTSLSHESACRLSAEFHPEPNFVTDFLEFIKTFGISRAYRPSSVPSTSRWVFNVAAEVKFFIKMRFGS